MNTNNFSTFAEIDLKAIEHNYKLLKSNIDKNTEICCVVKANAYGHGAVVLAKFYEYLGVKNFAVANISEGLELRNNGIKSSILILGYTTPQCAKVLYDNNLIQTVYSLEYAKKLSSFALKNKVKVSAHIKIDTGMGRLGFRALTNKDNLNQIKQAVLLDGLLVKGLYTHLSVADMGEAEKDYTFLQINNLVKVKEFLINNNLNITNLHCLNSAGILDYSNSFFSMVRAGVSLYGYNPSNQVINKKNFIPAMSLIASIVQVKVVNPGESVGYGREFVAIKKTKIAIVSIGYADGYFRCNAQHSKVLVKGVLANIVGRICMDQLMIEVTDIPVKEGDKVVIFGKNSLLTAESIATNTQTICYEVLSAVSRRVPRVYKYNNKIVFVQNYLNSEKDKKEDKNEVDRSF